MQPVTYESAAAVRMADNETTTSVVKLEKDKQELMDRRLCE